MISTTVPEPALDIAAQFAAMLDDEHPKRAVWVSAGSGIAEVPDVCSLSLSSGTLYSLDVEDCERLAEAPSDATLATILGYTEPKHIIIGKPIIVQARHGDAVVTEMACSVHRIGEAVSVARHHGDVTLTTPEWALLRRVTLWNQERAR